MFPLPKNGNNFLSFLSNENKPLSNLSYIYRFINQSKYHDYLKKIQEIKILWEILLLLYFQSIFVINTKVDVIIMVPLAK